MKKRSEGPADWEALRRKVMGLGERSFHKSYYPELQKRIAELERFRGLLDESGNGIFLAEVPSGNLLDVNAMVQEWTEIDREELLGRKLSQLFSPDASPELERLLADHTRTGADSVSLSTELATRRGRGVPVELNMRLVSFDHKPYAVVIAQDITERQRAQQEKDRLERQLRQAQKLEAVGRLAGGMAHDFNNLLAVIMGYTQLALAQLPPDDPFCPDLKAIDQASQRAATLIRQLLTFSRKQILQPKVLDLNRLVAGTEQMLRRLIGEDIDLVTILDPDSGRIKADPGQIEQLIVNLAVNARDAIEGIGRLTMETTGVLLDEAYCRQHPDLSPGRYAMLALSDTGEGMDEETKLKIFDPFFTTKDPDKGTGLGLATVYGIVKQSGGSIYVHSEPGQGTTFRIYLPQVEDEVSSVEQKEESFPRGTETVLVVEDEEGIREIVLNVLRYAGYKVIEATNGDQALDICRTSQVPVHLLITDLVMPKMSGRELARRLMDLSPDTKVLFMSGYTGNIIVNHGMLKDGVNFLAKPFTPAALAQKIRKILDDTD